MSGAELLQRARRALGRPFLRRSVRFTADRLRDAKARSTPDPARWEEWRERARAIRAHTIEHLDLYLERFSANLAARGGRVHYAADAEEARRICLGLLTERGARTVAKSKSMVTEEVDLNPHLEAAGVRAVETDLGEWIVQLAGERPSHIILPAIHKRREEIRELFEAHGGAALASDTATLAGYARRRLREEFLAADAGVSGCNFAVAESGSLVLFTNEGNGRMVTTLPRTHVVFLGMERIVPTWADLEVMAEVLPRSATGQKLTTYLNVLTGPRRPGEADGPAELHVIVLDNGRSRQLGDPAFQAILHCIRCGACLNVCPVYRQIGGHAYGWTYPGPIGAVLMPLLEPFDPRATELAGASSLCGACSEACPVKIPLHDMLVAQRRRNARTGSLEQRLFFRLFGLVARSPRGFSLAGALARRAARLVLRGRPAGARSGLLLRPLRGWLLDRDLPCPPARAFRERWAELAREGPGPAPPPSGGAAPEEGP